MKKLTKTDIVTILLCLCGIIPGLAFYGSLPQKMPIHFNINNVADSFAPKPVVVFVMPLAMCILQLVLCIGSKKSGQEEKAPPILRTLVRLIIPLITIIIESITVMYQLDLYKNIGVVVICFVSVLVIVMGNYMPKCRQNNIIGYKMPWTLKNETVWNKTHRLAGWLWTVGGIALLAFGLLEMYIVSVILIAVIAVFPAIYSAIIYKKA